MLRVLFIFLFPIFLLGQNRVIDSLKLALKNAKHDTIRCSRLLDLANTAPDGEWPKYNDELRELAENKLKTTERSSAEYKSYQRHLAHAWNNAGYLAERKGDSPTALEYFTKILKIREEIGDKKGIAISLSNIGFINLKQGDRIKALEYIGKSLKIREEIGDKKGLATVLNNLAVIYQMQGDNTKALKCLDRSLKIKEEIGDKEGIANILANIGGIYDKQGETEKALDYNNKSLNIKKEIGDKLGITVSLNNMGGIYYRQKNYAKALEFTTKSLNISREIGFPEKIRNASGSLSTIYKAMGNYRSALENYELFIKMRDSIDNIETQKATIKQQTKYQYDKEKAVADEKHASEIRQQEEKAAADKKRQYIIIASVSAVLLLVAVFSVILFNRFRVTQKQKTIIEIKERETQFQKHLIEEKHKEITDSINYAERIQRSFLATESMLQKNLKEYFVLFKPKDVVSGDFYWSAELPNGNFALAAADSTGHGVPGAIMSLLNITSLEKAIEKYVSPDEILMSTRKTIIERLKKDGSEQGGKDGMDCGLLVFNFAKKQVYISAANNPVWIVRQRPSLLEKGGGMRHEVTEVKPDLTAVTREVIEVKADKMPVGKHDRDQEAFTKHTIDLKEGDVIYALTDGFPDQFGGAKGKKYLSKNLREFIVKQSHLPMYEQKILLEEEFKQWVGDLEQIDDVTVIGITT